MAQVDGQAPAPGAPVLSGIIGSDLAGKFVRDNSEAMNKIVGSNKKRRRRKKRAQTEIPATVAITSDDISAGDIDNVDRDTSRFVASLPSMDRPGLEVLVTDSETLLARAEYLTRPLSMTNNYAQFVDSITLNLGSVQQPLPRGLTIISGRTGVGKSSFVRHLASTHGLSLLSSGEPVDVHGGNPFDDADPYADYFQTVDAALAAILEQLRVAVTSSDNAVISPSIIDSLRAPLFETSGPAGAKGIVMPFFTKLTRLSNAAAALGLRLIATVNPMDSDESFYEAFVDKLSASVPCFIAVESVSYDTDRLAAVSGYISVRPRRDKQPFSLNPKTVLSRTPEVSDPTYRTPSEPYDVQSPLTSLFISSTTN